MARSHVASALFASSLLGAPASASAAEGSADASAVSGVVRPERRPGDEERSVSADLLAVPRQVVDFLFWGSTVAVGVVEREQVVPRVQSVIASGEGRFVVLPTALAETGRAFNVGLRTIADFDWVATGFRVGFGGVDSVEMEPRIAFATRRGLPTITTLELLWSRDDDRSFLGVGQVPEDDARNRFLAGRAGDEAEFFEERVRFLLGLAARLSDDLELAVSGSVQRRFVNDLDGRTPNTLSRVFEPGSVDGALATRWTAYGEVAARVDTRATRGRPSPGWLVETYAGTARGVAGTDTAFVRLGGRVASFLPIVRSTNVLSPKLVLDGLARLGDAPVPFTELTGQPDFRGLDTRRDNVSLVGSVDYRWVFVDHLAARLFVDVAAVAPAVESLDVETLRPAVGVAVDLHIETAEVGQLGLSVSPEGPRLLFSIGVATGYGDRQHRR